MKFKHTMKDLQELQAKSLEDKVALTKLRIMEFYEHFNGNVHISFSGGKDSTVLLTIARQIYPDIKAMFVDTGLEYPEIKAHVKSFSNVDIIRPEKTFLQVIQEYGYPVIGKQQARAIAELQNPTPKNEQTRKLVLTGINSKGEPCKSFKLADKYHYLQYAPFKVSAKCCDILKKGPAHKYERERESKPIMATMACESRLRANNWLIHGCNSFSDKNTGSKPMSFWFEDDVLKYIHDNNIRIASVYGDVVRQEDGSYATTKEKRTGCIFCMFGAQLEQEPNRFQRLAITHPKLYDYCMNKLGIRDVLDYIGVAYEPKEGAEK